MTPTLTQVLSSGGAPAAFNPFFLAFGLVAFLVAVVSVVKGRELYHRNRLVATMLDEKPVLEDINHRERIEKLSFLVDQLKLEKQQLAAQNTDLASNLSETKTSLDNAKQNCALLEKSSLTLAHELDKIKAQQAQPPIAVQSAIEIKTAKPFKKAKVEAKVISKKEGARKPHRVSRKAK